MLKVNKKAPQFILKNQYGNLISLEDTHKTGPVLVYFYPKDNTPVCTIEACQFRDDFSVFCSLGITVLGINVDGIYSHKEFSDKISVPFSLLSDEEKEVSKKYGVWGFHTFPDGVFEGVSRTSFLIDEGGFIRKIYEQVDPQVHTKEVIEDVMTLLRMK